MYNQCFIEKLESSQSKKKAMLTLKNGFYVCRNKNQIPVVYDIHAFYNLED